VTILTCLFSVLAGLPVRGAPELSIDIWDWTAPAQDLATFEAWVADLKQLGHTRVEVSVPWRVVEPRPGEVDVTWAADRLAICKRHGLGVLWRINSYLAGAVPDWYTGARWAKEDGTQADFAPPSIVDEEFWAHFGAVCTALARLGRGEDVYYNAFIGIHAELKWADWWSYDVPTLGLWRAATVSHPRPDWLRAVVDDGVALPERPTPPAETHGTPDRDPANRAWIAFREQCWRLAMVRFVAAVRAGDPDAVISCPLGESYRRGSAAMSNLDYWGLTRGANHIVHSYDFFWHVKDGAWMAAASVDAFRGITGLPVQFEYDSLAGTTELGYSEPHLLAIGREAARAGAGLKLANNSYRPEVISRLAPLVDLTRLWQSGLPSAPYVPDHLSGRAGTVLLFVSKWANYAYREPTEWLHEAQFGVYKLFSDLGIPVRIICEDNLDEDLSGYRLLYLAFSPRELMPGPARERLATLTLPMIEDMPDVPPVHAGGDPVRAEGLCTVTLTHPSCPVGTLDLAATAPECEYGLTAGPARLAAWRPGWAGLGYPVGVMYLHDDAPWTHQGLVLWAMRRATGEGAQAGAWAP